MENFSDGGMLLNAKGMLLYDRYISSLGSLWALRHLEPDLLFLFKFLEAACVDSSVMNKNIWSIFPGDETESLLLIEPLDSTLATHTDSTIKSMSELIKNLKKYLIVFFIENFKIIIKKLYNNELKLI